MSSKVHKMVHLVTKRRNEYKLLLSVNTEMAMDSGIKTTNNESRWIDLSEPTKPHSSFHS